jgi:DNA-binding NtrC family response regulator
MQNREKSIIFVVDDEEIIASTIAAILRLQGLDAVAFTHSSEALQASRSMAPDLLISDILMPVLSGAELAQHIQWSYPECRVLLFTGEWDRAETAIAAFEDGLRYQLISKPVHPKALIEKVREMLAIVSVPPASGEDRARLRTMENMRQTFASVQAEIAIAKARKRSVRRRVAHHSEQSRPAS